MNLTTQFDLKYPRQSTFIKQVNIAHGPQKMINAGMAGELREQYAQARAPAGKSEPEQNKLMKADHCNYLDTRAQGAASRINPHMATVG